VAVFAQDDWGGGIFRGRRAPPGTVYDAVNALVDDEGQVFKRTGSAYKSDDTSNGETFDMLADVYVAAGRRTLFSGETAGHLWALGNDDHTPRLLGGGVRKFSRPVALNGFVFFPGATGEAAGTVRFYAGSLATVGYSTGTVTVTNGSTTVTGAGTAWLANADAGMILGSGTTTAAVKSVDSDTQITLLSPWPGATAAGAGYALSIEWLVNFPAGIGTYAIETKDIYLASVGQRLLYAGRQRVYESNPGRPVHLRPELVPGDPVRRLHNRRRLALGHRPDLHDVGHLGHREPRARHRGRRGQRAAAGPERHEGRDPLGQRRDRRVGRRARRARDR
jgi:hypothetical protein